MFINAVRRGLLTAAALLCLAPSAASAENVRSFTPVGRSGDKVVFRLTGVQPVAVTRARLHHGKRSKPVPVTRVRRGARRGHVQLKLPRSAMPRGGATRSRLVVLTACTAPTSARASFVRRVPGLIGFWRLDERTGDVACDAAGRNPARYTRGVRLRARGATNDGNGAVALDGRTGAVRAPSSPSLNPTDAVSAEAWVNPSGKQASQTIVRKEGQYLLRITKGALVFRIWTRAGDVEVQSPAVLQAGEWQHVAATYDGSMLRVFHAGRIVATLAASGALATGPSAVYFGASIGTYDWLNGSIDDVALYSTALSENAIESRAGLGRAPGAAAGEDAAVVTPAGAPAGAPGAGAEAPKPANGPATNACPDGASWQTGFGAFKRSLWPNGCWRAYEATSPFNTPIPADAPSWQSSDEVVGWFNRQGPGPLDWPMGGYNGYQAPTYYGTAEDPVYTILRDPSTLHYGKSNVDGQRIHAPDGMKFNRDYDSLMTIVDQTTGVEYDFWYVSSIDETAKTITVKWGGQLPVGGSGVMDENGYAYESGFGMQFGVIRYAELMAGEINHALYLCVPGVNGRVAPAIDTGGNFADQAGMPPMGGRVQITLTDAEIEGVTLDGRPAPWYYKVILRAAKRYGMIVSDEGDSPWGGLRTESGLQYEAMGQENVWKKFAREQDVPTSSGPFGSHPYFRFTDLKDPSGQSVWRNIRVVSPTAHGYSAALQ